MRQPNEGLLRDFKVLFSCYLAKQRIQLFVRCVTRQALLVNTIYRQYDVLGLQICFTSVSWSVAVRCE